MANQRKGVPSGWTWRDGRPRWIPSPTLRKAGWKGTDLKDPSSKQWLGRGPSITAADAIVQAVAGWRTGALVPASLAASAPAGACERPGAGRPAQADRRSIGYLLDAYAGNKDTGVLPSQEWKALAPKTQMDRRSKLSRMIDVLAGYTLKPPHAASAEILAKYADARAAVRGFSIDVLAPPAYLDVDEASKARGPLYDLYWKLRDHVGKTMAHGVLSEASTWLEWCAGLRAVPMNWAKLVDRETPPGRIRVGTWKELRALIASAEALGLPSIADAIILGVDLSWNQVDRLPLKWAQIDAQGRVKATRQKTGRRGETPLLAALGVPRLQLIRQRQAAIFGPNVKPTHVLICELTGKPWSTDLYRHKFADVRAHAAATVPSVATLQDGDLRDTAITVGKAAGLSNEEIASRSLHSLKRIADVLDKHYVEIGQDVADAGALKLNDYLAAKGVAL
ncbi:hypothetical protein [Phenylobacterium sp.]|uniref:hypothetical protein n=1 Tax=Phenylobacterium sp. TaxID=1871053 RepID=UPI002FC8B721